MIWKLNCAILHAARLITLQALDLICTDPPTILLPAVGVAFAGRGRREADADRRYRLRARHECIGVQIPYAANPTNQSLSWRTGSHWSSSTQPTIWHGAVRELMASAASHRCCCFPSLHATKLSGQSAWIGNVRHETDDRRGRPGREREPCRRPGVQQRAPLSLSRSRSLLSANVDVASATSASSSKPCMM